jgi:hypothetical protein
MDRQTESAMALTATTLLTFAFVIAIGALVQFCG